MKNNLNVNLLEHKDEKTQLNIVFITCFTMLFDNGSVLCLAHVGVHKKEQYQDT